MKMHIANSYGLGGGRLEIVGTPFKLFDCKNMSCKKKERKFLYLYLIYLVNQINYLRADSSTGFALQ
jgi:hypothetical protein